MLSKDRILNSNTRMSKLLDILSTTVSFPNLLATRLQTVSFHSNPKERQCQKMFKLQCNCAHFTYQQSNTQNSSRLQQYVNRELPDVQAGFRKGSGTRDSIANILQIIEKAREFKRNPLLHLTTLKPLTAWTTTNCGKF